MLIKWTIEFDYFKLVGFSPRAVAVGEQSDPDFFVLPDPTLRSQEIWRFPARHGGIPIAAWFLFHGKSDLDP